MMDENGCVKFDEFFLIPLNIKLLDPLTKLLLLLFVTKLYPNSLYYISQQFTSGLQQFIASFPIFTKNIFIILFNLTYKLMFIII